MNNDTTGLQSFLKVEHFLSAIEMYNVFPSFSNFPTRDLGSKSETTELVSCCGSQCTVTAHFKFGDNLYLIVS